MIKRKVSNWKYILWLSPIPMLVMWFVPISFTEPPALLVNRIVNMAVLTILIMSNIIGFYFVVSSKKCKERP